MSNGATPQIDIPAFIYPPNRAVGELRASFKRVGSRTKVDRTFEGGGLRLRFPKVVAGFHPDCEAVCINTGGGMVGGDAARLTFDLGEGAAVTVTTQSAEKIYRAESAPTTVDVKVTLAANSHAEWLPQETILFDRANLQRKLDVAMAPTATLLLTETLVFGRLAMGETVTHGAIHDRWRIRRGGALIFAEDLRLSGDIAAALDRPAVGGGARALATLLLVSPDAEARLDHVRAALAEAPAEAGASAWNAMLSVRVASPSPDRVRTTILGVLKALRGQAAPRVWQ